MKTGMRFFTVTIMLCLELSCSPSSDKDSNAVAVQNDFPPMAITTADGTQLSLKELTGKVVLILFQTDCDHCQREAAAIQQNISAFAAYSLYFITTTSHQEIQKFADEYKLTGYDNVHFCNTSSQNILDSFGPIDAPSVYIYSNQNLIKAFNGQTNINEILKFI